MHDEVNMINPNAASDGRKSDRVSGYYAHGIRPSTVWVSALATGDEMSCAAELVQGAGLCAARRQTSCSLCSDRHETRNK